MASSPSEQQASMNGTRTIATYSNYREAERAIDSLSDQKFPVEQVSIVGRGLHSVEQVVGRVTTGRAALAGAGYGAVVGLFISLLFGLFFSGQEFWGLFAYSVSAGVIFGAIYGAIMHAAQDGRRDFASVSATDADVYEVQAETDVADEARQMLDRTAASPA
jgi:hypothetical protein